MSNTKKVAMGVGAVLLIAGGAFGASRLLNKDDSGESESSAALSEPSASSEPDDGDVEAIALASVMPDNVLAYAEVPSISSFARAAAGMKIVKIGLLDLLSAIDTSGAAVGTAFDLSEKDGANVVSAVNGISIGFRLQEGKPELAMVISIKKPAAITKLLTSARFKKTGEIGSYERHSLVGKTEVSGALPLAEKMLGNAATPPDMGILWLPRKGLLYIGSDGLLTESVALANGEGKSLATTAEYSKAMASLEPKARAFAYAPASAVRKLLELRGSEAVADAVFVDPGPFLMAMHTRPAGVNMMIEGGLQGPKAPKAKVPAAAPLDLAVALPKSTFAYLGMSTKLDMSGKEAEEALKQWVQRIDASNAEVLTGFLGNVRKELGGVGFPELVDALGDQFVMGAVSDAELSMATLTAMDLSTAIGVVALQDVKDLALMKKIVGAVLAKSGMKRSHTTTPTADGGFDARPKGTLPFIAVRFLAGDGKTRLFAGVGPEKLVKAAIATAKSSMASPGPDALGSDGGHTLARSGVTGQPHLLAWIDGGRLIESAGLAGDDQFEALASRVITDGDRRGTGSAALSIRRTDRGYRLRADMLNGFFVIPAIAIGGVRRYLSAAKSSEAKNTVGALSRAAVGAYERVRADGTHKLCGSASPVPGKPPSGQKYTPNSAAGSDFETGDDQTGWKCLKFSLTQPHYYQYGYSAGGPYKGPAVGGPNPGPNGYEGWAIGDLDGDGVTSLFTVTGTIDAKGVLKRGNMFIHNEVE